MSMNKRIWSLLLCGVMLICTFVPCVCADEEEAVFVEERKIAQAVGIWDDEWDEEQFVTRAVFAKVAVMLYNPYFMPGKNTQSYYYDVDEQTQNAPYINEATRLGYMMGVGERSFAPETTITLEEAVVVLMRALGYGPVAASRGGFSSGYMNLSEAGTFLKGLSGKTYQQLTNDTLAKLIVNSFDAKIPDVTTDLTLSGEVQTALTLRDMYTDKGIVTANERTSLVSSNGMGKGKVKIGEYVYESGASDAGEYLGKCVDYIFKVDKYSGENTVVCVYNSEKYNKEFTINARDILKFDFADRRYIYETGENRQKNITFEKDADIIYNSKAATIQSSEFKPESGGVTLLDNDKDGEYEVVFIDSYIQIFVSDVDSVNGRIYDDEYTQNFVDLKLNDNDTEYIITDKSGRTHKLFEIEKKNIISAAVSKDGKYAKLIFCGDSAEGVVQSVNIEENIIKIADVEYNISSRLYGGPAVSPGERVTAYLDYEGSVAAFERTSDELNFAYLTEVVRDDMEEEIGWVRIFTEKQEFLKVPISDKIRINDEFLKDASYQEIYDALYFNGGIDQIIEYSLDDNGDIVRIDTEKKNLYKIKNLNTNPQGGLTSGITGALVYHRPEKTFSYRVYLRDTARIFMIPQSDLKNKAAFRCIRAESLENGYDNAIEAYNTDEDRRFADVIVIDARVGEVRYSAESSFGVVKSIKKNLDSYGDVVLQMEVITQNGDETVILENADGNNPDFVINGKVFGKTPVVTGEVSVAVEVNPGDTVRFTADNVSKIVNGVQIVFDCATKKFYSPTTNSAFATTLRVTGGKVTDLSDNIITVEKGDIYNSKYGGVSPAEFYPFGKCTTVSVDISESRPYIKNADSSDVSYRAEAGNSWYIFWTRDRNPKFAVIYNGLDKNPNIYLESEQGFAGYTEEKPYIGFVYPYSKK